MGMMLKRLRARSERGPRRPLGRAYGRGQMTVELAVAFPVLIIVAAIAVNAILFFSECASFDRIARQAVRIHATAPAYGKNADACCAAVEAEIATAFNRPYVQVSVERRGTSLDFDEYTATIEFWPTLFGMGLRDSVFGVALPHLTHTVSYTVDTYKPGVFI